MIVLIDSLDPIAHEFRCLKPVLSLDSGLIPIQLEQPTISILIHRMTSPLTNRWEVISTHDPLYILQSFVTSNISLTCDMEDTVSCSICGLCSANTTDGTRCVGVDGEVFGATVSDCPNNTVLDRGNTCCPLESVNCAGYCNTMYSEALDSTGSYPVCCLTLVIHVMFDNQQTIDCMNVCGGHAVLDTCGVCSGGLTSIL